MAHRRYPRCSDVRVKYVYFNFEEWLVADKPGQHRVEAMRVFDNEGAGDEFNLPTQ